MSNASSYVHITRYLQHHLSYIANIYTPHRLSSALSSSPNNSVINNLNFSLAFSTMPITALLLAKTSTSRYNPAAAGVPAQLIALLDDTHLARLTQNPSRLRYDPDFQIAGSDLEIDPPTVLCKPCRALMRNPPIMKTNHEIYNERWFLENPPPPEKMQAHHSSVFELMDCCSILDGGCHLCQLFWYEFKRVLDNNRQDSVQFSLEWPRHMLEVCIENNSFEDYTHIWTNLIFQSRDVLDPKSRRLYLFFDERKTLTWLRRDVCFANDIV